MSTNESLKELQGRSVRITVADVDDFLNEQTEVIALQGQITALENEAHKAMSKAKELQGGEVADAASLRREAKKDMDFKAEVLRMMEEQIRAQFYGLEEVQLGFDAREKYPAALKSYRAACSAKFKQLKEAKCAKERQEWEDAVQCHEASVEAWKAVKAKADEQGQLARGLFDQAKELRKELVAAF